MGDARAGIIGTSRNDFYIGDATDGYKYLYARVSTSPEPGIRYNPLDLRWEYSNTGLVYTPLSGGGGGGGSLPVGTSYQLLQYVGVDWAAVNDITLPKGAIRDIKLEDSTTGTGDVLRILAANGAVNGDGGLMLITGGDGDGTGDSGDIRITAGDVGGSSSDDGGLVLISGGDADSGDGGSVEVLGGSSNSGSEGHFIIGCDTNAQNRVFINSYSDLASSSTDNGYLAIKSTSSSGRGIVLYQTSTDTEPSMQIFSKYRGTFSSPTTIASGDYLGQILFGGYDGASSYFPVKIATQASGAIASGSIPSKLTFHVGNDDSPPASMEISNVSDTYSLVTLKSDIHFEPDIKDWEIKVEDSTDNSGDALSIYSGHGSSTDGDLLLYRGDQLFIGLDETDGVTFHKNIIRFDDDVTPTIKQTTTTVLDATGAVMEISSQSSGNGSTTGGELRFISGSGNDADGDITFYQGSNEIYRITAGDTVQFEATVNAPTVTQDYNDVNAKGYTFTLKAQDTRLAAGAGGDLYLKAGSGKTGANISGGDVVLIGGNQTGSGTEGNIAIQNAPVSWQSGERVLFVGDAATLPTGNPTSGGFMFSDSGAGKWRGSSGTVTTFGPAEPHCPNCGRDYALEWENAEKKERLSICMWCLVEKLESSGIDPNSFIISR